MEITHLDKKFLYEALAKECNWDHGDADCWHDAIGIGCPFSASEDEDTVDCNMITADHWREVFECKDKPEPEFHFGDKVRVDGMRAVFARYSDTSHKNAYILFESGSLLPERRVATLKAGWE